MRALLIALLFFGCATVSVYEGIPNNLPPEIRVGGCVEKDLQTVYPVLTHAHYEGYYEGQAVNVWALTDEDIWIAFLATWVEGDAVFVRYYIRDWDPGGAWVLTNYQGYDKFIRFYVSTRGQKV